MTAHPLAGGRQGQRHGPLQSAPHLELHAKRKGTRPKPTNRSPLPQRTSAARFSHATGLTAAQSVRPRAIAASSKPVALGFPSPVDASAEAAGAAVMAAFVSPP